MPPPPVQRCKFKSLYKIGLSVKKDVAMAHGYFCIENSVDDCQFDLPNKKVDWVYFGPMIACSVLTVFNLLFLYVITRKIMRLIPTPNPGL